MNLINPFSGKGQGNSRERLNQLEMEVMKIRGVLTVFTSWFEIQRRFFLEVTAASQPEVDAEHPEPKEVKEEVKDEEDKI